MKNSLMLIHDKIMLKKRTLIEKVNNDLKNMSDRTFQTQKL